MFFGRIASLAAACAAIAWGQGRLASLKTAARPQPSNLDQYVRDNTALAVLGKALFWDVQLGSDGQTACATCHFHAGADHRLQNQLASPHSSEKPFLANRVLTAADFPFRKLADPLDNRSAVLRDTRQVAGSAGVVFRKFVDITEGAPADQGDEAPGPVAFLVGDRKVRQVTGRNTPTVINSLFYVRNFWDGRASNIFTGATPFGDSDSVYGAMVMKDGKLETESIRMENASLASQAVGPALNDVEMSYQGRTWEKLSRKIYSLAPLGLQRVAADDSLLGPMSNAEGNGLRGGHSYGSLVRAAFRPAYWESEILTESGLTQAQHNFPLFLGLAIQAYEAMLISDESRFDRFMEGDSAALTAQEQDGIRVFNGASECHECHEGPEFSNASFTSVLRRGQNAVNSGVPDTLGFFRTGVSPMAEDVGANARDSFGNQLFAGARGAQANGVFKSPSLRNVELTGPYFHDGSQATLEQVLEFYARLGDFPGGGNLGPGMNRIRVSAADRAALVALMKSLTDDRVRFDRAPFDHPSLCIPIGHVEASPGALETDGVNNLSGRDRWALIPAVGRSGHTAPLQTFEELLNGVGNDGSRSHTLAESCEAPGSR